MNLNYPNDTFIPSIGMFYIRSFNSQVGRNVFYNAQHSSFKPVLGSRSLLLHSCYGLIWTRQNKNYGTCTTCNGFFLLFKTFGHLFALILCDSLLPEDIKNINSLIFSIHYTRTCNKFLFLVGIEDTHVIASLEDVMEEGRKTWQCTQWRPHHL